MEMGEEDILQGSQVHPPCGYFMHRTRAHVHQVNGFAANKQDSRWSAAGQGDSSTGSEEDDFQGYYGSCESLDGLTDRDKR